MTVGRSGSTSLMETIEGFADVAVPNKNLVCEDNELLHAARIKGYMEQYARFTGSKVGSPAALIDAFFAHNDASPYAGFKSMPNRHKDYAAFTAREDIQFITLGRRDVASTAASFLRAEDTGTWRRHGEKRGDLWRFDAKRDGARLRSNLAYVRASREQLEGIRDAIHLSYEDLCTPDFAHPGLDEFFGRAVRIANPRPATSGSAYVENWDEFCAFVQKAWAGQAPATPRPQASQSAAKAFCVVLGGARGGATLVGRLLDAHPAIGVDTGDDILRLAAAESEAERFTAALADRPAKAVRVKGGVAGEVGLSAGKPAMAALERASGLPLKVIHIVRSPLDTVSLLCAQLGKPVSAILGRYLESADATASLLAPLPARDRHLIHYEDLLADPRRVMREACAFLGVQAGGGFLEHCARIVAQVPREERPPVPWPVADAERLRDAIKRHAFLAEYGKPAAARSAGRATAPGRIFYAWELGMDLGHLLRFLQPALRLRERGHQVAFAVRDLSNAESTLGRHGFTLMQAPIWIAESNLRGATVSYPEIILRYGFLSYPGLKALVKAWRELFRHARPDLVLCDHSPAALLAARIVGLPYAPIGSGFFSPPQVKPLPTMRYWIEGPKERLEQADAVATRTANRVIADFGGPRLESLADLFRGDENFLCTFEELDHYPGRDPARYWGPTYETEQGLEVGWPAGDGPKVFAYLKPRYRDFAKVLDTLAKSGARVVVYAPGISRDQAKKLASDRMRISRDPVRLKSLIPESNLTICHGGPGTVTASLLAGVPLLILPTQLEQYITSRRISEMGSGLFVDLEKDEGKADKKQGAGRAKRGGTSKIDYSALIRRLLGEKSFGDKARAFAEKYKRFNSARQAELIARRIEELIAARPRRSA
jgi:UDP:flavonoid glycosyltransferase YjiC (YdhE family)